MGLLTLVDVWRVDIFLLFFRAGERGRGWGAFEPCSVKIPAYFFSVSL